jgi:hypothetical protein
MVGKITLVKYLKGNWRVLFMAQFDFAGISAFVVG